MGKITVYLNGKKPPIKFVNKKMLKIKGKPKMPYGKSQVAKRKSSYA